MLSHCPLHIFCVLYYFATSKEYLHINTLPSQYTTMYWMWRSQTSVGRSPDTPKVLSLLYKSWMCNDSIKIRRWDHVKSHRERGERERKRKNVNPCPLFISVFRSFVIWACTSFLASHTCLSMLFWSPRYEVLFGPWSNQDTTLCNLLFRCESWPLCTYQTRQRIYLITNG